MASSLPLARGRAELPVVFVGVRGGGIAVRQAPSRGYPSMFYASNGQQGFFVL